MLQNINLKKKKVDKPVPNESHCWGSLPPKLDGQNLIYGIDLPRGGNDFLIFHVYCSHDGAYKCAGNQIWLSEVMWTQA